MKTIRISKETWLVLQCSTLNALTATNKQLASCKDLGMKKILEAERLRQTIALQELNQDAAPGFGA